MGFRNLFGLAPIPVSGNYAFGGFVNLNILHPTAGREALSRESIQHVANIVELLEVVKIAIVNDFPPLRMVVECYKTARDVFDGFVKDFVREHLYPNIRNHVPSSTRQGRDALYRRLKENKELFRYEEREYGKIESLLADYLSGKTGRSPALIRRPCAISAPRSKPRADRPSRI